MVNKTSPIPTIENRKSGLDIVRVIACFFVIMIHVTEQGFFEFSNFWNICVAYDALSRMCVPLFFILSGYLLLNGRPLPLKVFYQRRFLRILVPFFITLIIYSVHESWSITNLLYNVLSAQVSFHLWFVYTLIGIYLVIPLFQHLFAPPHTHPEVYERKSIVKLYVIIWFISAICYSTAKSYFDWKLDLFAVFNFHYFYGYLGYFFIGGLLRDYNFSRPLRLISIVIWLLATILIYYSTVFHSAELNKPDGLFLHYLSIFVVLQATSFFIALKDADLKFYGLEFVSNHTYWIYLIHILVLYPVQSFLHLYVDDNTLLTIPLISILVFFVSFALSIPLMGIEKLIFQFLGGLLIKR